MKRRRRRRLVRYDDDGAAEFSERTARVNGLNELKSHYVVKRFEIFGLRARMEPSDYPGHF